GEVHVLFDFRRIFERVRSRDPHALVQRNADTVRELLQRHRSVLVVVVRGKRRGDVGGGVAGAQLVEAGVHRVVDFAVQIDFFLAHLRAVGTAALEAAHEVDEVAGRPDGVDVDDDQVALTNELVGGPAAIWARVATRGDDDV